MTLHLHRAERTDLLADQLGALLAKPLPDPFADEVVVVPARGVERWLTQRLSHRLGVGNRGSDGVCAGVRFLAPSSLVSLLLGRERDDLWHPDRLVWPLLQVIDDSLGEPWCATLSAHLGHGVDGEEGAVRRNRRYAVARRLAGLFSSYAVQRPQVVTDWRMGEDTDGAGGPLDPDLAWQPELWRRLLAHVDEPAPDLRHAATLTRLRDGGDGLDLPDRLSLFGHTRLPVTEIELLDALATSRDVHLWLPQPSRALWDRLEGLGGVVPRIDDDSALRVDHPLLASLGRDSRELRRVLAGATVVDDGAAVSPEAPNTLLGWLQSDLRANEAPGPEVRAARVLAKGDRSVQVHACHGSTRQVDVLREVLVGLLDDDPSLEPRDILVMCPDIEAYAPLISAGFGLGDVVDDGHPAHRLRVRLADRSLASTNPLLAVAATLVELSGSRVTATEVLDLASTAVVRRRFRFSDDDLDRITRWVGQAGVRWGLDAPQRAGFAMQGIGQNTWRAGLDRILLGVAMSGDDHRHVGSGLPLDDVGSGDVGLVGRLTEFVHRLDVTLRRLATATGVEEWMSALEHAVADLTDVPHEDGWLVAQFERELARAAESGAGEDGTGLELRQSDVRALLRSRLAGRPTRANFRTGTLTVCTMVPMRSVPHRVVCLVGLDDTVFPRVGGIDGDDVLARRPLTGERDVRSEDRQLLLDAVLAATETLVITYTGANEHSGASRPPAVPLGEILDAVDRTTAAPVRDRVLVPHPLQPFDQRNFTPGKLVGDRPFSFDSAALAGAVASAGGQMPPSPFLAEALEPAAAGDVNLADLKAFFRHPVRHFLRHRLDVSSPLEAEEVRDGIPIDLDGLETWGIGDRLLREVAAGHDPQAVLTAEQLSGSLPPGVLGQRVLGDVVGQAQKLFTQTEHLRAGTPRSLDVDIRLDADPAHPRRLTGTVTGVYGNRRVAVGYSRLKATSRLEAWIDMLALSAGHPDENWTSYAVGRAKAGPQAAVSGPMAEHDAVATLRTLVELYDAGMRAPLPLPAETARHWAEQEVDRRRGAPRRGYGDPVRGAWESSDNSPVPGEREDAWHTRVFGEKAPLQVLLEAGMRAHAWTLWEPLLAGGEKVGPL